MTSSNNTDWKQVRIDASINIMNALLSNSFLAFVLEFIFRKQLASLAVKYADELIEELKQKKV